MSVARLSQQQKLAARVRASAVPVADDSSSSSSESEELYGVTLDADREIACVARALACAGAQDYDRTRELAQQALSLNPASLPATRILAGVSEHHQDWSASARAYMDGLCNSPDDEKMRHGFNASLDLIRQRRPRFKRGAPSDGWSDGLSMKPDRSGGTGKGAQLAWAVLDEDFESLVSYIQDLIDIQTDPAEQALEIRRVLYFQKEYLKSVFRYYAAGMDEDLDADTIKIPAPHPRNNNGLAGDESMPLHAFWRLCKEARMPSRVCSLADIDRLFVLGRHRLQAEEKKAKLGGAAAKAAEQAADDEVELMEGGDGAGADGRVFSSKFKGDPHDREMRMQLFDYFETVIRVSWQM